MTASSTTRYGWVVVGIGLLSLTVHSMVGHSSALFLVAISNATGWSRTVVSTCLSASSLGSGLWVPVLGFVLHAWSPRWLLPVSALILMGGLLALSVTQDPLVFALAMLFPVALGNVGVGGLVNFTAIQPWFLRKRGTALALAATGSSLGILLMPLLQNLILDFGWRVAYRVMAVAALALAALHLFGQRQPPSIDSSETEVDTFEKPTLSITSILCSRAFWLVFLGLGMASFSESLIMFHDVAYIMEQGFDPLHVATVLEIIGIAGLIGRNGFGLLSDQLGSTSTFALVIACMIAGIGFLICAGEMSVLPGLYVFGALFGASFGVTSLLFTRLTADLFGRHNFARVTGLVYMAGSIGIALGPVLAGAAYDVFQGYLISFGIVVIVLMLSLVCVWLLRHAAVHAAL